MAEELSSNPPGEVKILAEDGDSSGVKSAEVDVLEESNEVGLSCLLKGKECGGLEPEFGVMLSGELTDESLEWESLHKSLGALLVPPDISEGDGSGSEPELSLLDATFGWGGLAAGFLTLGSLL